MVCVMTAHLQRALERRDILAAYVTVLDGLEAFFRICTTVRGGRDELRVAVREAFGLSEAAADAVLALQIRRLSPEEQQKTREELTQLDTHIARMEREQY